MSELNALNTLDYEMQDQTEINTTCKHTIKH